jgi:hypothetical protein
LIVRIFTQNKRKSTKNLPRQERTSKKQSRGSPLYKTEQNMYLNEGA